MRHLIYNTIAIMAISAIFASGSIAQVRRSGGSAGESSGTAQTRRSSGTATRSSSSGTVNESSSSSTRQTPVRRSSGSYNSGSGSSSSGSSSGTVRRSSGSGGSSSSSYRRSDSNNGSSSSSTSSPQVYRRSSGSASDSRSQDNGTAVRRSSGSTYSNSSSNSGTAVRRSSSDNNNGTSSHRVARTISYDNVRSLSGRNQDNTTVSRTSATSNGAGQALRSNNNVTRRGLGTVNESMAQPASSSSYDNSRDFSGASANQARRMNGSYDDFYIDNDRNVMRIHPREREIVVYDRLGHFYGGDPHYFGYRIDVLPPHYRMVRYYGVDYYYYNDVYYRPYGGHYVVCRPPFGIYVNTSIGSLALSLVNFAFYTDMYRTYRGFDSYSRYIDRQNMIIAQNNATIAAQNNYIAMNLSSARDSYSLANQLGLVQSYAYANQEYYYQDGIFYIMNGNQYQVIVPPAGALVEELPDDYDVISLGGTQYYRVDDTVYRVTMMRGRPMLEVLGQMYGSMARQYSIF